MGSSSWWTENVKAACDRRRKILYQWLWVAACPLLCIITCQNFQLWQVCSFVGLCVCLSVCLLSTRYRPHRLSKQHQTWHKYGTCLRDEPYTFWCWWRHRWRHQVKKYVKFWNCHNFSNIWARSRSKAQNVGHALGFFDNVFNFRWHFRRKSSPQPYNFVILKIFEIFIAASTWHQILKDRPKLCKKKYFHGDDVIDDVTGRPQNRPSIFP